MIVLSVGLFIWISAHSFKRIFPNQRAELEDRFGQASKGVFALAILVSIFLMSIGYRGAEVETVYWSKNWFNTGLNNLLMILAVVLFGLGSSKSRYRNAIRHPMLMGVVVWALAHIVVNGHGPAFFLFGTLAAWGLVSMFVINRAEPEYELFEEGSREGDQRLLIISAIVYAVIAAVHWWLGYIPFGG